MKRIGVALVCAAVVMAATSASAGKVATVSLNGVGTFECGRYLAYRKSDSETMTPMFQQWAAGYFAGYGKAFTKPGMETDLAVELETYTAGLDALIKRRLKKGAAL